MNRKPYLRELTVTIQQPHCALATNPVGLYIRRNDEKVTRKDTVDPWTYVNATRQKCGTQAVPTFTQSCTFTCTEHQPLSWPRIKAPWPEGTLKYIWVSLPPKTAILVQQQLKYMSYILNYIKLCRGKLETLWCTRPPPPPPPPHIHTHIMPPASSFINLPQRGDITNKHSPL